MKNERPVQYFTEEYLESCKKMTTEQIVKFLDDFRKLHAQPVQSEKSKLISIKIPENLLSAFRQKSELNGLRYQTQIKELMRSWILKD